MTVPAHSPTGRPSLPTDLELVRVLASQEHSAVLLVRRGTRRGVLRIGRDAEMLRTEVALFSKLDTPGLVAPQEWGTAPDGSPYVLRPYVEGEHFADAVRGASTAESVAWTQSVLSTCEALHRAGYVHRDIKSSNVIVRDDRAFLIDLDLVGELGSRSASGSAHHVAPEVLLGGAHTAAADLFSVGAMVAYAFCGDASSEYHTRFPYRSFWEAAELDPERLPPDLRTLVRSLVRRHPKDRPPSAAHAVTQLSAGGKSLLPPLTMPFLFGREASVERWSRALRGQAPVILLGADDPDETDALAAEVALRAALAGHVARPPRTTPLPIQVEESAEAALGHLRESLLGSTGCVVVVPAALADTVGDRLREEFEPQERSRFSAHILPRPTASSVEQHLLALSGRSSPTTARSLARSLVERSDGQWARINRCLTTSVDAGVLRPLSSSFVLLRDEWPRASTDGTHAETLARLSDDARHLLSCLHVLGERATASLLEELSGLDGDALSRVRSELHATAVTCAGATSAGLPVLADPSVLDAAAREADAPALEELHRSALELLRARGCDEAALLPHLARSAATGVERASVLQAAREELEAGRPGKARELVANLKLRASTRPYDPEPVLRLELELDVAQGSAAEGLEELRRRFGEDLAGATSETWVTAARALEVCGHRADARELYARARSHAASADTRARAALGMAYGLWLDGRAEECLEFISGLPGKRDPVGVAGAIHNLRAGALAHQGRHAEAHAELDLALACARRAEDPTLLGRTELNRAYTLRREGRSPEALDALGRAAHAFDEAGHLKLRSLAINNRGVLHRDLGELRDASECLHDALRLRRATGDAHGIAVTAANLGFVALDSGELGAALEALDRARARCERGGYADELRFVDLHRVVALARSGRGEEAHALLRSLDERSPEPRPLLVALARAEVALARDREEQAVRFLEKGLGAHTGHDDGADRLRAARLWLVLCPDEERAARELRAAVDRLPSRVRLAEAEWTLRRRGETPGETLLQAWLEAFEKGGRTDLVAVACRLLARAHDAAGRTQLRRRSMARARATEDALLDGLTAEEREPAAARLRASWERELGSASASTPRAGMSSEWLLSWNRRLAQDKDLEELTLATLERAREVTAAERGFLVILDGEEIEVHVASGLDLGATPEAELQFSRTVVRQAIASGAPIVAADAAADPRFAAAKSVRSMALRSVLCVPLPGMDGLDGALYLDGDSRQSTFDEFDAEAVRALSDQAAIAVLNLRRQQEVIRLNERLSDQLVSRENELTRVRDALRDRGRVGPVGELIGHSAAMQELFAAVERLAPTDLPVHLWGPRGSEIGLVARALHDRSRRARGPFLTRNLSALPADAIEDELFGHAKGTYGSGRNRLGLLSKAERGTLFLDGIEELPTSVQEKLLDAVETGVFRPAGSHKDRPCDVRLITSARTDLTELVRADRFSAELYHLIDASEIEVPSLRDRAEDLPALIQHCVARLNKEHGTRKQVSEGLVAALVRRPWPGELRELTGEVTRLYFVSVDSIDRIDWIRTPGRASPTSDAMPASYRLEDVERSAVARALEASGNNKEKTARLLGISRAGLYKKLKRLGLDGSRPAQ